MNNEEIINKIQNTIGIDHNICKTVIKAFEANSSPLSVIRSFLGSSDTQNIATTIASKTGIDINICEQILATLTSTVKQEIKNKKYVGNK